MKRREQRMERLAAVRREFQTALVALDLLAELLRKNPSALAGHNLRPKDHKNLRGNIEDTFLIRLFAEWESGLRDFWKRAVRDSNPRTAEMIDSLASRRAVPPDVLANARSVRNFRNALVHEESANAPSVTLTDAAIRLRRFFSHLPAQW